MDDIQSLQGLYPGNLTIDELVTIRDALNSEIALRAHQGEADCKLLKSHTNAR